MSRGAGVNLVVSDPLEVPAEHLDLGLASKAAANAATAAVVAANAADEHLGRGLELEPVADAPDASGGLRAGGEGGGGGVQGGLEEGEEGLVIHGLRQSTETLVTDIALLDSAALAWLSWSSARPANPTSVGRSGRWRAA